MDKILAHEGSEEQCAAMICIFKNAGWNGVKKAGDTLILEFNSEGTNPSIISFTFNGATCNEPTETATDFPSETPPGSTPSGDPNG